MQLPSVFARWRQVVRNDQIVMVIVAAATGVAVAYAAIGFRLAIGGLQWLGFGVFGERLLDTAEDRVEALTDLGRAYEANDRDAEAVSYYDQALTLDPDSAYALGRRSVALGNLERWDEAEADLRHLITVQPDRSWPRYRLGWLLNQTGRYQDSVETLERAAAIAPNYEPVWSELGQASRAHARSVGRWGARGTGGAIEGGAATAFVSALALPPKVSGAGGDYRPP